MHKVAIDAKMATMKALKIPLLEHYQNYAALLFLEEGILVHAQSAASLLPFRSTLEQLALVIHTVYLDNTTLIVKCSTPLTLEAILGKGFIIQSTKHFLYQSYEQPIQSLLFRAIHCLQWDTKLHYCSQCGNTVQKLWDRTEKKCLSCNLSFFPHFSPAMMVLIQKEDQILLARSKHFEPGMYSALAGFIDLGETAEMAVHREVKEEVGLEISNLDYFGTQPWPFPDSFMIAFKARYLTGDLQIDPEEIEDAQWFDIHDLPKLPPQASIARKLIDSC